MRYIQSKIQDNLEVPPELARLLACHHAFGSWHDTWKGVPLAFRTYLADETSPREFIASVRAVTLRNNEVLLVHGFVPLFVAGGRAEAGETLEQTLRREVAEETGWRVKPLGVIGFIHVRHLDEQRPDWGRPAPNFSILSFAAVAEDY